MVQEHNRVTKEQLSDTSSYRCLKVKHAKIFNGTFWISLKDHVRLNRKITSIYQRKVDNLKRLFEIIHKMDAENNEIPFDGWWLPPSVTTKMNVETIEFSFALGGFLLLIILVLLCKCFMFHRHRKQSSSPPAEPSHDINSVPVVIPSFSISIISKPTLETVENGEKYYLAAA
ncbi:Hypothetical predicted protein [Octopus vulgaris]|uniref:Uncharacterized protein n=1 Tax=Octopus vulgaris TaxID=6645 RepID=A0AA36F139_OCTVU|nr:Hypothetical predicted protein [Octopus vulgaris]